VPGDERPKDDRSSFTLVEPDTLTAKETRT